MGSDKLLMSASDAETSNQSQAAAPAAGPGAEKNKDEALSRITSAFQGLVASGKTLADHLTERWSAEKHLFKKARLPRMLWLEQHFGFSTLHFERDLIADSWLKVSTMPILGWRYDVDSSGDSSISEPSSRKVALKAVKRRHCDAGIGPSSSSSSNVKVARKALSRWRYDPVSGDDSSPSSPSVKAALKPPEAKLHMSTLSVLANPGSKPKFTTYEAHGMDEERIKAVLQDTSKCSCAGKGPACYAKIPFKLVAAACRLFHKSLKSSQDALLWSLQANSTEEAESSSGDSDHDIDRCTTQRHKWFFEGWFVISLCVCLFFDLSSAAF